LEVIKMSLLLDTKDSKRVTLQEVYDAPAPIRDTSTYQPVANKELLDMLHQVACSFNLQLTNPNFGLARLGQRMFGVYEVEGHDHCGGAAKMMLGVRNSGDGHMAAGVCFGSKVFVCSNLAFTGYAGEDGIAGKITHKHTVNVMDTLYERLTDSLKQFNRFRNFQEKFYKGLQSISITDNEAYAIIVKSAMIDAIPNKDIIRMADRWISSGVEPEKDETKDGWYPDFMDRNAWSLFNTFTHHHKDYQSKNLVEANRRSINLTRFFNEEFKVNPIDYPTRCKTVKSWVKNRVPLEKRVFVTIN
jgi:hypothetical protein